MAKSSRYYYILMADIVDSRLTSRPRALMSAFTGLVKRINTGSKEKILSPLTITLGDEFQGLAKDLSSAIELIFEMTEECLTIKPWFELRFVVVYGKIDTSINTISSHGMMGEGLTFARWALNNAKKRGGSRFQFFPDQTAPMESLNLAFKVLDGISRRWPKKDFGYIADFLKIKDYKLMAKKRRVDPSQTFRRKNTLLIDEYFLQKKLISLLAQ